jgi:hypothetical protein
MKSDLDDTDEMVAVRFTVHDARPVTGKAIFALVDVEMHVGGISFDILGIQARTEPDGRTSVRLPAFRDTDGSWRAALRVPPELAAPLADTVLTHLVEQGLAKRRFTGSSPRLGSAPHDNASRGVE